MSIYLSAYSGGMALGAVLGPVVAAGGGWQNNFYYLHLLQQSLHL